MLRQLALLQHMRKGKAGAQTAEAMGVTKCTNGMALQVHGEKGRQGQEMGNQPDGRSRRIGDSQPLGKVSLPPKNPGGDGPVRNEDGQQGEEQPPAPRVSVSSPTISGRLCHPPDTRRRVSHDRTEAGTGLITGSAARYCCVVRSGPRRRRQRTAWTTIDGPRSTITGNAPRR